MSETVDPRDYFGKVLSDHYEAQGRETKERMNQRLREYEQKIAENVVKKAVERLPKYKIALARFPGQAVEHKDCTTWLMKTFHKMKSDPRIEGVLDLTFTDTPIPMLRNRAVKRARAHGCQYLLMVDSDMGPDYMVGKDPTAVPFWDSAWHFMMDRRQREINDEEGEFGPWDPATIAAPYCGPPPEECCYIFHWRSYETIHPKAAEHQAEAFKLEMIPREDAARRSGIEEAAALPTGLILYDMRVFDVLEANDGLPWFDYEYDDQYETEKASTEDVYQTRNASLLGCPQFVHWNTWAIHHKAKAVLKPHVLGPDAVGKILKHAAKGMPSDKRVHFVQRPANLPKPQ